MPEPKSGRAKCVNRYVTVGGVHTERGMVVVANSVTEQWAVLTEYNVLLDVPRKLQKGLAWMQLVEVSFTVSPGCPTEGTALSVTPLPQETECKPEPKPFRRRSGSRSLRKS